MAQQSIKLTATLNGKPVTSQNCNQHGIIFQALGTDSKPVFTVTPWAVDPSRATLTTKKNTYILKKHPSQNYYWITIGKSVKVHVILKKMVGELIFWGEEPKHVTKDSHGVEVTVKHIIKPKREADPRLSVICEIKLPEGYMDGTTKAPRKTLQIRSYIVSNGKCTHRYIKSGDKIRIMDDQLDLDIIKMQLVEGAMAKFTAAPAALPELFTPETTHSDPNVAFANLFPTA